MDRPKDNSSSAFLSCPKDGCPEFRIIIFSCGHVDLACGKCGATIDHTDIVAHSNLKLDGKK